MYQVKENMRTLPDGKKVETFSHEITSANVLEVEAGTTGYMGGDTGHGGRTYFRIEDKASTDIKVNVLRNDSSGGFEVILGGDCELYTMIRALKFIVNTLEEQAEESKEEWGY